jgi:hypothetical protein
VHTERPTSVAVAAVSDQWTQITLVIETTAALGNPTVAVALLNQHVPLAPSIAGDKILAHGIAVSLQYDAGIRLLNQL